MIGSQLLPRARDGYWPIAAWIIFLFYLDLVGAWRVIVLASSLAAAIALSSYLRRRHARQGREGTPGWTILATFAAVFFCGGIARIVETNQHYGPGIVTYGGGDRYPERDELVGESTYKGHNYTMGAFSLFIAVLALYLLRVLWKANSTDREVGSPSDARPVGSGGRNQ